MRLSDAALVVLIGLPGAQASHQPTITSILTELPDDLRGELPAKYAGIWRTRRFEVLARRESEGAMARVHNRPNEFVCMANDPEYGAVVIRRLQSVNDAQRWYVSEAGWVLTINGVPYAYLLDQATNLAIGRILRFQDDEGSQSVAELEPQSLLRALELERLPFIRYTSQLKVDAGHLMHVLRNSDLTFEEIAGPWTAGDGTLPPCEQSG